MKVWIDVLGCPKNEADSSAVMALLEKKGHEIVGEAAEADVIVVNTCGFIASAKEESVNEIFKVLNYKKRTIVHGCLVQRYSKELREGIPEVSAFLGVVGPEKVVKAVENPRDFVSVPEPIYKFVGRSPGDKPYAYLKIGDGCSRRCAFCAIPSIKGPLKNRKILDVVEEAKELVAMGKREIILVSQDLTQYQDGDRGIVDLMKELDKIDGDFWIRLLYLYPNGVSDELIDFVGCSRHFLHYFDIPIQHASSKILNVMRRNPDVDELRSKFLKIRNSIDDAILRTTVMVGFPSENNDDFKELLDFISDVEFDRLGAFIYSEEKGTEACSVEPKVSKQVAQKRYDEVMEIQREVSLERNKKHVGKTFKTLVEGIEGEAYYGRSYMDAPEIDGYVHFSSKKHLKIGDFVNVKIEDYEFYDLEGVGL